MKYSYGVVHAVVQCDDCDWNTCSYKNAQALAAKHAKKYSHNVSGELGIAFNYYGKDSLAVGNEKELLEEISVKK